MKKITVWYGGSALTDESFIISVDGKFGIGEIGSLEEALPEEITEGDQFTYGIGEYDFSVSYDSGQFGEYGQCEIRPHWEFDFLEFRPEQQL